MVLLKMTPPHINAIPIALIKMFMAIKVIILDLLPVIFKLNTKEFAEPTNVTR